MPPSFSEEAAYLFSTIAWKCKVEVILVRSTDTRNAIWSWREPRVTTHGHRSQLRAQLRSCRHKSIAFLPMPIISHAIFIVHNWVRVRRIMFSLFVPTSQRWDANRVQYREMSANFCFRNTVFPPKLSTQSPYKIRNCLIHPLFRHRFNLSWKNKQLKNKV